MLSPSLTINVSERVGKELQLVVLVFYLLQGFLGGAVEFELHDVAVLRGLKEQVDAAVAGVVLRLRVEAHHLEHHPHHVLEVVLPVALHAVVGRAGEESLQAAEELLYVACLHVVREFLYVED